MDDMDDENGSLERTLQQEYEQNTSCEYQVKENLIHIILGDGKIRLTRKCKNLLIPCFY